MGLAVAEIVVGGVAITGDAHLTAESGTPTLTRNHRLTAKTSSCWP